MLGSPMSSTLICRGMSFVIANASVASESSCLFFPWATWVALVVLNFAMICVVTLKYSFIRESHASMPYSSGGGNMNGMSFNES